MTARVAREAPDVVHLGKKRSGSRNRRVQFSQMIVALCVATAVACGPAAAQPLYSIVDIGLVPGEISFPTSISPGGVATVYTIPTSPNGGTSAFYWTQAGGRVNLPNLPTCQSGRAIAANDSRVVVGFTGFTNDRLPVIWQGGVATQLPLPAGQTQGDANGINNFGVVVGSVGPGGAQRGVIYSGGTAALVTQTTPDGAYLVSAFGINDAGRIVGAGYNPVTGANVGYVLDPGSNTAFSVGALPGSIGSGVSDVNNAGHAVGASRFDQYHSLPFIWTDAGGIRTIPLVQGTNSGGAASVNSAGWVVGTDRVVPDPPGGLAIPIPFLYDGVSSYRLADLIPAGSGWNLLTGSSSFATGISDSGVIVGSGYINGDLHAFAMIPVAVPESGTFGLVSVAAVAGAVWRRRFRRRSAELWRGGQGHAKPQYCQSQLRRQRWRGRGPMDRSGNAEGQRTCRQNHVNVESAVLLGVILPAAGDRPPQLK
jgi:uncharacterized membrane protein